MLNHRTSLPQVLAVRAADRNQVAYRFLRNDRGECETWTYRDLEAVATRIAAELQPYDLWGKRVMLPLEPGLLYIAALFGIMKVGAIAVPCHPPASKRAKARFAGILVDCAPDLIITEGHARFADSRLATLIGEQRARCHVLAEGCYRDLIGAPAPLPPQRQCSFSADTPALLQYTSGSTGSPKGVVISHGNLIANCQAIERTLVGAPQEHVGCSWLPPYHDMGLMGGILLGLYSGFPLVLMSPAHFAQNPYRWLKAISEYRATISPAPNFALDLCVDSLSDEEAASLDLSSLRQFYCGAEPVQPRSMQRFSERFAASGFSASAFVPCYGMAEATLFVSGKSGDGEPRIEVIDKEQLTAGVAKPASPDAAGATRVVSCGSIAAGHELAIVDADTRCRMPAGIIGEIWLRGPSIAREYWQRPGESIATFGGHIAGEESRGEFLRTGDLGFVLGQELFVTGRLNDVIVIAGRHLYPQDIERSAMHGHDLIRVNGTAAFLGEMHCPEQLVVVAELSRRFLFSKNGLDEVRRHVRAAVRMEHGVTPSVIHLAPVGSIPLTTSGKVRRNACRNAYLQGTLPSIQPIGILRESRLSVPAHFASRSLRGTRNEARETVSHRTGYHKHLRVCSGRKVSPMECEEAAVCAPLDPGRELLRMVCWIGRDAQLTSAEQVEERAQLWGVLMRQALELFEDVSVETAPAVSVDSTDCSDAALAETCLPEHAFIADGAALLMTLAGATLSNGRELSWIDVSLARWFARCLLAAVSCAAADGQSLRRVGSVASTHTGYEGRGNLHSDSTAGAEHEQSTG